MHNIIEFLSYLCPSINPSAILSIIMKKTTAFSLSSLLLLGGMGYLAAKVADLDLSFFFDGDDDQHHYC